MKKLLGSCLLLAAIASVECGSKSCQAEMLHPTSYDLPNGQLGGDVPNFFDDTYTGTGNKHAVLAPLTGGLGDLTDGVIATTNWNGQYLRYVGWASMERHHYLHQCPIHRVMPRLYLTSIRTVCQERILTSLFTERL